MLLWLQSGARSAGGGVDNVGYNPACVRGGGAASIVYTEAYASPNTLLSRRHEVQPSNLLAASQRRIIFPPRSTIQEITLRTCQYALDKLHTLSCFHPFMFSHVSRPLGAWSRCSHLLAVFGAISAPTDIHFVIFGHFDLHCRFPTSPSLLLCSFVVTQAQSFFPKALICIIVQSSCPKINRTCYCRLQRLLCSL